VRKASSARLSKEQAESRLEKLEEIYRGFEAIQRQLLEQMDDLSEGDAAEEEIFEQKYFEVKALLRQFVTAPSEGVDSDNSNVIMRLLQQQSELMQQIGRGTHSDTSARTPSVENEAIAAILSQQTEILDRVAAATRSVNVDTRVKLPTIKLPRFDGKIEEWNKTHLLNIEKFQYLISSISGDAAKIIDSIDLTDENYTAAHLKKDTYSVCLRC